MLVLPLLHINITWQHVHFAVKMYNLLLEFILLTKGIFLLHGSNNLHYIHIGWLKYWSSHIRIIFGYPPHEWRYTYYTHINLSFLLLEEFHFPFIIWHPWFRHALGEIACKSYYDNICFNHGPGMKPISLKPRHLSIQITIQPFLALNLQIFKIKVCISTSMPKMQNVGIERLWRGNCS